MSLNTLFKYYACRCRSTCGSHSKGIWAALPVTARSGANAPTSSIRAVQMHQRWWRSGILHLDQCMWVVRCFCCCCTIAKRRYVRRRANMDPHFLGILTSIIKNKKKFCPKVDTILNKYLLTSLWRKCATSFWRRHRGAFTAVAKNGFWGPVGSNF